MSDSAAAAAAPQTDASSEAIIVDATQKLDLGNNNNDDLGFGDLKKKSKKKKKEIPMDLEAALTDDQPTVTPPTGDSTAQVADPASTTSAGGIAASGLEPSDAAPATATDAGLDLGDGFGDLKKKKKSGKKKAAFDLEAFEKEIEQSADPSDAAAAEDPAAAGGDLGDDVFGDGNAAREGIAADGEQEAWLGSDRDYTYPELLGRFFRLLHAHNPELAGDKKKLTLVPPQVSREGTKKTLFANLADICKRMHRQPKHVMEFLFAELGTSGSVDGNQRLIVKGRYTQKSMENVLRRYIVEYVVCKTCKSPDTLLNKENRLYFITCESCGSKRSVAAIKTGYQAQVGRRIRTE